MSAKQIKPYELTPAEEKNAILIYSEGIELPRHPSMERALMKAAQKKMLEYLIDIPDAAFQELLKEFGIGE